MLFESATKSTSYFVSFYDESLFRHSSVAQVLVDHQLPLNFALPLRYSAQQLAQQRCSLPMDRRLVISCDKLGKKGPKRIQLYFKRRPNENSEVSDEAGFYERYRTFLFENILFHQLRYLLRDSALDVQDRKHICTDKESVLILIDPYLTLRIEFRQLTAEEAAKTPAELQPNFYLYNVTRNRDSDRVLRGDRVIRWDR